MSKFSLNVNAFVTIMKTEHFIVEADSVEEAEEKARGLFSLRMWEEFGYADWDKGNETIDHYCNDWEAQ